MADRVQMQTGETRQLRASGGQVAQWTSSTPSVATVTDEDVASGRPGGLVTAVAEGQARITALGFEWEILIELDIVVEGLPSISIDVQQMAPLPQINGVSRWVSDNEKVAVITDDGQVRGISPGIAVVQGDGEGTRSVQCSVHVIGIREVEIGQPVSLAEYFSVSVKSWRSSVGEVEVDTNGVVHTGASERAVDITAELENGEQFTFELQVMRPESARSTTPSGSLDETQDSRHMVEANLTSVVYGDDPLQTAQPNIVEPTTTPISKQQRQEIERQLTNAERYTHDGNWEWANAELIAARTTALQDAELLQHVNARIQSLLRIRQEKVGEAMVAVLQSLADRRYDKARTRIESLQLPQSTDTLSESVRQLVTVVERSVSAQEPDEQGQREVQRFLCDTWHEALRSRIYSILSPLAQTGLQFGDYVVTCIVDTLSASEYAEMPLDVRRALETHLVETGEVALKSIADRLCDAVTTDEQIWWLLQILPGLPLRRHAHVWIKCFAVTQDKSKLRQKNGKRLVTRLCKMQKNAGNALLNLLAGVLSHLPTDQRLIMAIQKQIGKKELEQLAVKWAETGHKGAQEVLVRMYGYSSSAFSA